MKLVNRFFCSMLLINPYSAHATGLEQDMLVRTHFTLKAGGSETRTVIIRSPENSKEFQMLGFDPVKALSVSCTLNLYGPSNLWLGRYNCADRRVHHFNSPLPASAQYKALIEVSNSNFTSAQTTFSVLSRFKFI
ncbi:hypothetical protein EMM73_13185 [Rheinheimera sediminis]|uniref:hypothetical protein n=1 Tax=Rheinheimera sp. YQF-1 TaxID=2499626 RepID=UPI000FDC1461|nr:hypothetical protein [Rheinheimera sp. YQF-1]RVT45414.1 hypothetical protein EMM73_13185 [Rheinheimera sp. YQF-1]